jgi:hypothetical protein
MAMQFLITKYFQKDADMASTTQISERWHLANEQQSSSVHSTVHAIRAMMPEDMDGRTDDEIME